MNKYKKFTAVILAVALIASLINVVALASAPLPSENFVFTYFDNKENIELQSGTTTPKVSNDRHLVAISNVTYYSMTGSETWAEADSILRATAAGGYMTYYNAEGFRSFYFTGTVNQVADIGSSSNPISNYFKFYTSTNGTTFSECTTTITIDGGTYAGRHGQYSQFYDYKFNVPVTEDIKYVKIEARNAWWNGIFNKVEYDVPDTGAVPKITVTNKDGDVKNNSFSFSDDLVATYSIDCTKPYEIEIKKNGNIIDEPLNKKFSGRGEYEIKVWNDYGENTFTFEIADGFDTDIIYAQSAAIDTAAVCFEQNSMTLDTVGALAWVNMGHCYHVTAAGGYVTYNAPGGFADFSFRSALNSTWINNSTVTQYYKVYGSKTGSASSYEELKISVDPDFTYEYWNTDNTWASFKSNRIIVDVSKEIKFIKIMPQKTTWDKSIIAEVNYSEKDATNVPVVTASSEEGSIYDGDEAFSKVTVNAECPVKFDLSATKDGNNYKIPDDKTFTEAGQYVLTASSDYGRTIFKFTITKGIIKTYDFMSGYDLAVKNWRYVNQADSGELMINQLGESVDYNWWGLSKERTYLTLGSDKTGWNNEGWFVTDLKDEEGNKYTGMTIVYNGAYQNADKLNQKLKVYASYDGGKTYSLAKPITSDNLSLGNIAVQRYTDTYDFGTSDVLVKISLSTAEGSAWEAGKLGILKMQLLALPAIDITSQNKSVADNSVATADVSYSITNAVSAEIYYNDGLIDDELSGNLTADGLYTIKAYGKIGYIEKSFILTKDTPLAVAWDVDGEFITDGATLVDDVKFAIYNGDATATKDSNNYTLPSDNIILKNGVYAITVDNGVTSNTLNFTLARPKPTINTKDFWSNAASEGSTVKSDLEVSFVVADSYEILKDGKPCELTDGLLTENGVYKITASNHAGDTVLNFTIEHFPELPAINHTGDVVEKYNYDVGGNTTEGVYRYKNVKRDTSLKGNKWVGVTNAVYNLVDSKNVTEGEMIFQAPIFKSFGVHVIIAPTVTTDLTQSYKLYASSDSLDYKEIEYTYEHNQAYLTSPYGSGYTAYRIVPKSIPENTKYIKLVVSKAASVNAWDVGVFAVEYSYNKSDIGKFDQNEIAGLISSAEEGESSKITLTNDKGNVLSKDTMSKLENTDKGLEIDIVNSKLEDIYKLSFLGSDLYEVRPYNLYFGDTIASDISLLEDELVRNKFSFSDAGDLPITTNVSVYLGDQKGQRNVYVFYDGEWVFISSGYIEDGWLSFTTEYGGDYVISTTVIPEEVIEDNNDDDTFDDGDDTVIDDIIEDIILGDVIDGTGEIDEPITETAKQRLMKVTRITRLKTVWLVVFIVAGVLLLAGIVVGTIFLIKFLKKRKANKLS